MTASLKLATCFIFSLNFINCLGLELILDGASLGMYIIAHTSVLNICQFFSYCEVFQVFSFLVFNF